MISMNEYVFTEKFEYIWNICNIKVQTNSNQKKNLNEDICQEKFEILNIFQYF